MSVYDFKEVKQFSLWPGGSRHSVGNNQIELVRHLPPFRYPLVYQRERMFGNTISDVQFPKWGFGSITKSDISIPRAAMAVARQH